MRFFFLFLALSSSLYGAQDALVRVPEAKVYADSKAETALGILTLGTKLRVGKNLKGGLLPLIVSGKVAYIKESDISLLPAKETPRWERYQGQLKLILPSPQAPKDSNFNFSLGGFQAGNKWQQLNEQLGGQSNTFGQAIMLKFDHDIQGRKLQFSYGFSYFKLTGSNLELQAPTPQFELIANLQSWSKIQLDLLAGFYLTPFARLTAFQTSVTDRLWGWNLALQYTEFFDRLGYQVGLGLQSLKLSHNTITYASNQTLGVNAVSLTGPYLYAGLNWRI